MIKPASQRKNGSRHAFVAPPTFASSPEDERCFLGSLVNDRDGHLWQRPEIQALRPIHFFDAAHRILFSVAQDLHSRGVGITDASLLLELKRIPEGSPDYTWIPKPGDDRTHFIFEIANSVPRNYSADGAFHAANIVEQYKRRELQVLAGEIIERTKHDGDVPELLSDVSNRLKNISAEASVQVEAKPPLSARELIASHAQLREPVVHGLLRLGEIMNVIAPPKYGKSWLVLMLALCVAMGRRWLGFETTAGNVLILDNELHGETLASRIPKVAEAMGLSIDDYGERIYVQSLRGKLQNIHTLHSYFQQFKPGQFKLIVLDAFYRFMPPGTDENDNGAMAAIYNVLDHYAAMLDCTFVCIHHASKGNQSGKAITDVGAGAGAQSRATDTHLVLRAHEEPGAVVLDAAVRSWAPISPVCLRWDFPIWTTDESLDPTLLKQERPRRERKPKGDDTTTVKPLEWTRERFATDIVGEAPKTKSAIEVVAMDYDISEYKADRLLRQAMAKGLVHEWRFGHHVARQYATKPQPIIPLVEGGVVSENTIPGTS